jgi:hypothetical protein
MLAFLAQYPRRVSRAYLFASGESVKGKVFHIGRLFARDDKLRHPLSD